MHKTQHYNNACGQENVSVDGFAQSHNKDKLASLWGCLEILFPRPHNAWELSELGMPPHSKDK
jgi:hypothetical protein